MSIGMYNSGIDPQLIKKLLPFLLLDLILRGISLWRSAQKKEKWWFIALMVVNSLGILPGIYLLTHRQEKKASKRKK